MKVYTKEELLEIVRDDPSPERRHIAGQLLYTQGWNACSAKHMPLLEEAAKRLVA